MARNQTRQLNTLLQLTGVVETSKGPKVSDDIQLTYQVSDLSGLVAPLSRPTFVASPTSGQNVARRGVIELRAPPDAAIVVPWWRNEEAEIHTWGIIEATQISDDLTTITPDVELGGASRAIFQTGTGGAAAPIILPANTETAPKFPDLIVPPSSILVFVTIGLNANVFISIAWFEVPVLSDTLATQ